MSQGTMHYNPSVQHQVDFANAFRACGFDVTTSQNEQADTHVIYGPHYCLGHLRKHPRVLYIDRAWWGHDDTQPGDGHVSIGWMQPDGSRKFASGDVPRETPEMEPWKAREDSCLILADYMQKTSDIALSAVSRFRHVNVRLHPANDTERHTVRLQDAIRLHDVAIGHAGTSIFESIRMGVPTICTDPRNPCAPVCSRNVDDELYRGSRDAWLRDMSYKQFSLAEIADGTAWNLLRDIQ